MFYEFGRCADVETKNSDRNAFKRSNLQKFFDKYFDEQKDERNNKNSYKADGR